MRKNNILSVINRRNPVTMIIGVLVFFLSFSVNMRSQANKNESKNINNAEILWHIKAIHPEGKFIDIKAINKDGDIFDVKAIQNSDQSTVMDIKALIDGDKIPIKMLVSSDKYAPVKAIMSDGTILDIKAITSNGDKLEVKGIGRSGNIIDIKVINKEGAFYAVKAISPKGNLNDVKGVKMFNKELEMEMDGIEIYAHVKAVTQVGCEGDNFIWHIIAIHPEGRSMEVMAFDKEGNTFPVKAIKSTKQRSVIDIKVYVDGSKQLPVKVVISGDKYAPVKAIGEDGSIYDIKAVTAEGDILDIKGVSRSGNVINIKALAKNGDFYGVKAISPGGELNDVKGVKMMSDDIECELNDVKISAHIKALPQMK